MQIISLDQFLNDLNILTGAAFVEGSGLLHLQVQTSSIGVSPNKPHKVAIQNLVNGILN